MENARNKSPGFVSLDMMRFWAYLLAIVFLLPANSASHAANSLSVTLRDSAEETIYRASLPSEFSLKADFKVDWTYVINYLAPNGYIGQLQTRAKVETIDLRTSEFRFFLPLNGKYKIRLTASIMNSGTKSSISYENEYELNNPSRYSIPEIPRDLIPSFQLPLSTNGDEIIQMKYGANFQIVGTTFPNGYRLSEGVKLVNSGDNSLRTETGDYACQAGGGELDCFATSTPGLNTVNLTKAYYSRHKIFYSSAWQIVIYNPSRDSEIFSYTFKDKTEINIAEWNSERSPAPDANGAKTEINCPESFRGTVLSCSFIPTSKDNERKVGPIWVEIKILADNVEQKKLTKLLKTKLGSKTSLKFQLPASYKDLRITATTLGIGGTTEDQSWVVTKPMTAAEKLKSYKSGYGSVMISSQANLSAMNFYSMATGADGRVVRSKAVAWCRYALQNQMGRGAQITSRDDWVRGCTDAAMKL